MKRILLVAVLLFVPLQAEEPAPKLTDVQKLQLVAASRDVQIWELKVQNAALEHERARQRMDKLVAEYTPAGYKLNDRLELEKLPDMKKDAK